jgi:hypothetical protein
MSNPIQGSSQSGQAPNAGLRKELPAGDASNTDPNASTATIIPKKRLSGGESLNIKNPILKYGVDFAYNPNDALDTVNRIGNLISAIPNFFGAVFAAFGILQMEEENTERIYGTAGKVSTITRGITGAIDNVRKGNPLPFIGSILEIPTALTSSGFYLWLRRGFPQSIRQIQSILKNRVVSVKTLAGEVLETTGHEWGNLSLGLKERVMVSFKELGKIFKEIVTNPRGKDPNKSDKGNEAIINSRFMLAMSTLQFTGPLIAPFHEKLGDLDRNTGGIGVDFGYMREENKNYKTCGRFWVGSAIFDFAKMTIENERLKGLFHHTSVFLDPLAAIFESRGNFDTKEDEASHTQPT